MIALHLLTDDEIRLRYDEVKRTVSAVLTCPTDLEMEQVLQGILHCNREHIDWRRAALHPSHISFKKSLLKILLEQMDVFAMTQISIKWALRTPPGMTETDLGLAEKTDDHLAQVRICCLWVIAANLMPVKE